MSTIPTSTSFRFEIPSIDDQHQQLIDLITRLDWGVDGFLPNLFGVLEQLQRYIHEHFTFEEALLIKHGYPDFAEHKHEHEVFEAYVRHMSRRVQLGKAELCHDVLAFLKLWLTRHIQGTDRKYAEWFKQQGIAIVEAPNGDTP